VELNLSNEAVEKKLLACAAVPLHLGDV